MSAELEFYKIHTEQSRHLEVQRSTIAGIGAAVSGVIVGELLKRSPLSKADLPYSITLMFVGLITLLFSGKLFERMKLHNEIARLARNKLDPSLASFRAQAEATIRKKYPILFWLPLHTLWNCFFGAICVLGIALTTRIVFW